MIQGGPQLYVRVIDGRNGQGAEGLEVELEQQVGENWHDAAKLVTDASGTVSIAQSPKIFSYRCTLNSGAYYANLGITPPLASVMVAFWVPDPSCGCLLLVIIEGHTQFTAIIREDSGGDFAFPRKWHPK
jgi:5-hydroxyisourate hydrolase-like protein (transthyretin family)